jgi:hypothetical protein
MEKFQVYAPSSAHPAHKWPPTMAPTLLKPSVRRCVLHHRTLLPLLTPSWLSCCVRRSSARRLQRRGERPGKRRPQNGVQQRLKLSGCAKRQRRWPGKRQRGLRHRRLQKLSGPGRKPERQQSWRGRGGTGSWRREQQRLRQQLQLQHRSLTPPAPDKTLLLDARQLLLTQHRRLPVKQFL